LITHMDIIKATGEPLCGHSQLYVTADINKKIRRDTMCRKCDTRITFFIEGVVAKARRGGRPRRVVSTLLPRETTYAGAMKKVMMQNIPLELRDKANEILENAKFEVAALYNKKVGDY